jgi:hypothetical protein
VIFVECLPDRLLVEMVGVPKREVWHAGNKSRVCKMLERNPGSKGMVDEDAGSYQPSYLLRLHSVEETCGMRRLRDQRTSTELVLLCPTLEERVIEAAQETGVRLSTYGLPEDGRRLHAVINANLERFGELLAELKTKSERLRKLREFLYG